MDTLSLDTQTWPELAIELYDKLTGRGAEVTYEFHDLDVYIPSRAASDVQYALHRRGFHFSQAVVLKSSAASNSHFRRARDASSTRHEPTAHPDWHFSMFAG